MTVTQGWRTPDIRGGEAGILGGEPILSTMSMFIVWPLFRGHYLTTFDDDYMPYYSSSQRMVDYGLACGWVEPVEVLRESRTRRELEAKARLAWQLTAHMVGSDWRTVRELADAMQLEGDVATLAHDLKTGVERGVLERRQVQRVERDGKAMQRWCYRLRVLHWERASNAAD